MVGVARLGKVTGEDRYGKAARGLADLLLHTNYIGCDGHATSTAVLGLLYTYELTGDNRYLDAAVQAVDKVFSSAMKCLIWAMQVDCTRASITRKVAGVADYFRLNMELGRLNREGTLFRQGRADLVGARSSITSGQAVEWGSMGSIPRARN